MVCETGSFYFLLLVWLMVRELSASFNWVLFSKLFLPNFEIIVFFSLSFILHVTSVVRCLWSIYDVWMCSHLRMYVLVPNFDIIVFLFLPLFSCVCYLCDQMCMGIYDFGCFVSFGGVPIVIGNGFFCLVPEK